MYKIEKIVTLSVGTTAQTVQVSGRPCLVRNNSQSAAVYFKDKLTDGAAADSNNGWALPAGAETRFPVMVMELSVVASDAGADVRVMILEEC